MPVMTFVQAIGEAIAEEMERDPTTMVMGEEVVMGSFGSTRGLQARFGPKRVRDTPITEAGFVGAAVGAAMCGVRPIVEVMFASFFYCAFDQLCNQAAKIHYLSNGQIKLPVTYRCVYGTISSNGAQHSVTLYPQLLNVPGLKLVIPSDPADAKALLKTAIREDNPVVFFEQGLLGATKAEVPRGEHLIPFGQAAIKHPGDNVTVIAIGAMVPRAVKAAQQLAGEGIGVEVLDPRTLVPLDEEAILKSIAKTNHVVIVDESPLRGSAASDLAGLISQKGFDSLDAPIQLVTMPDVPLPFSPTLENAVLPDQRRIEAAIRAVLG